MASTAAIQNPADLANNALVRMGYKLRVGSLYDGSFASKKILDVYAQTRDELLRAFDWDFADRNVNLTLQKSAPAGGYIPPTVWDPTIYPALPWAFQYAYPGDCLKLRAVKPVPLFIPNFTPQPYTFEISNDNSLSPPQRVINCNVANAYAVYTGQITDPTNWDVGFVEEFAASLGRHLGPALVGLEGAKYEAGDETQASAAAQMQQG